MPEHAPRVTQGEVVVLLEPLPALLDCVRLVVAFGNSAAATAEVFDGSMEDPVRETNAKV